MKKLIISITLMLASFIVAAAQSTNPLNYSGRMYVEAIEIIQTPRYVSYVDQVTFKEDNMSLADYASATPIPSAMNSDNVIPKPSEGYSPFNHFSSGQR